MTKALVPLGLVLAALTGAAIIGIASAPFAHADNAGGRELGKDPYPTMPADNDPTFVGANWHAGPMVGGNLLEYLAQVPNGDTTAMAVIVIGGGDASLMS